MTLCTIIFHYNNITKEMFGRMGPMMLIIKVLMELTFQQSEVKPRIAMSITEGK